MRASHRKLVTIAVALLLVLGGSESSGGGLGVSVEPEPITVNTAEKLFHIYRPFQNQNRLSNRDIEFMWSDSFRIAIGGSDGLPTDIRSTLNKLGENIAENSSNPLGIPVGDLRLVYDYFHLQGSAYDPDPTHLVGFLTGQASCDASFGHWDIPDADRSHVDTYLYVPNEMASRGGSWTSAFQTYKEDSTTGHLANVVSNPLQAQRDTMVCAHSNSIMYQGPAPANAVDTQGTGWAAADAPANWGFCHEFQHSFPVPDPATSGLALTELFSSAAEALVGERAENPIYEVPYTWPLLARNLTAGTCTDNFRFGQNYQGWRLFGAYLVYNFRGQDTTPAIAAIEDDLMHRWARNDHRLSGLRGLLKNDSCWNCAQVNYFRPGGVALDDTSRLALLLHNWRVANYVNNSSLAEGQYGYPSQFNFSPAVDVGAWQSFDGCGLDDDVVAIPPEVTVGTTELTRELTKVGTRFLGDGQHSYPMRLFPEGAEYWVVRSDAALSATAQDLVVTVTPESILRSLSCDGAQKDGRLVASVVPYVENSGSLWANPGLARAPPQPR